MSYIRDPLVQNSQLPSPQLTNGCLMPNQKLAQMRTVSLMTVSTAVLCDRKNVEPIYFPLQMDFCRLFFN